jgi:hypothetical protein
MLDSPTALLQPSLLLRVCMLKAWQLTPTPLQQLLGAFMPRRTGGSKANSKDVAALMQLLGVEAWILKSEQLELPTR